MIHIVTQFLAQICDPDHLCFRRTTNDNIDGPGGTIYVIILGPARPLMYPDQISRYIPNSRDLHDKSGDRILGITKYTLKYTLFEKSRLKCTSNTINDNTALISTE